MSCCGSCFGCLCNHCANNVISDHTPEEIELFCYNCDEQHGWIDDCLLYKPTRKYIEQQAMKRRKSFMVIS